MSDRRGFGQTVLLGLSGAGLAAVAGSRTWVDASGDAAGLKVHVAARGSDVAPLAGALALVCLAAWGVLLVTRGRVRQGVAVVGVLAALGAGVGTVVGFAQRHGTVLDLLRDQGANTASSTQLTGWLWTCLVGIAMTAAAFVVAVPRARAWPAMGSRYDAPGSAPEPVARDEPVGNIELWRALDEGRDPTTGDAP